MTPRYEWRVTSRDLEDFGLDGKSGAEKLQWLLEEADAAGWELVGVTMTQGVAYVTTRRPARG